nr:protein GPR107-like [Ipomoea trifida]
MPQRYKENFGSWMLVSRKARRGRGRGGGYTATGQRPNGFVQQHPRRPPEGIETSSRYAMLEELEGGENQPMQEAGNNVAVTPNRYDKLPRIRTNYRQPQTGSQQRAQNDNLYAPAPPVTQRRYAPPQRGGQNARGGRGRGSRQAAAETEHTVVRGYNKGKDITTTVVGRDKDQLECSQFVPEDPLLGDPPDAEKEIDDRNVRSDNKPVILFDEFGFTHRGRLQLNVSQISFDGPHNLDLTRLGFFLCTPESWMQILQQIDDGEINCVLKSGYAKVVFSFDNLHGNSSFDKLYVVSDAGQYSLIFANCLPQLAISMDVRSAMYNLEGKSGDKRDYLPAGKTILPRVYFIFSLVYFGLAGVWIHVLYKKRLTAFRIHFFMLLVVILKALNLLCEAEDKSFIKRTGYAHGWDVLFYIFSFLKGIMLFTLIVLIGTGWSFLKPYLHDREKKVLMILIPLQVLANIAQVVIDETTPYGIDWMTWKEVFFLVDVICCCAVLFPIVWSIKNLREAARTDGKAAVNLMKLTLFRHYYIVVICYIYFTRVVVYALETITSYRYLWTSVVAGELATLAFYVFTGYKFKPEAHNPYFVIDDDEEEAAVEALKLEDEFEL